MALTFVSVQSARFFLSCTCQCYKGQITTFAFLHAAKLSEQSSWAWPAPSIVHLGPEEGRLKKSCLLTCVKLDLGTYPHSQRVLDSLDFGLAKREAEGG